MAMNSKVGSFNIDTAKTAGQTQQVTDVGFTPKIVMFWWSGTTQSSDGTRGEDISFGFGAMSGASSRFAVDGSVDDANGTSTSSRSGNNDRCISVRLNGSTTPDGLADWGSFDADGFTITIDDQFSTALRVSYLALGGTDLTNVYIGTTQQPNATGNYNVTDVGFQPDCLIVANHGFSGASAGRNNFILSIGMATGSSNQGAVSGYDQATVATTHSMGYGYNGEVVIGIQNGATIAGRDSFVSFIADGFTLNELEVYNGVYYFICLKGGQYSVGDLTTRTDGNDISETVGFQPVALLFASANRALSTQDTASDHLRLSVGAGTSATNRAAQAINDEDNLDDSETATANYDSAVYAHVVDDAIVALMDIKSIDSNGFTCVMDDTEASECWVTYLAIGNTASTNIIGSTAWGHTTSAQEGNLRTFSGNWTGTGMILGTGDTEKILLSTGNYIESEVVDSGINPVTLTKNKYGGSNTSVLFYRTGSSVTDCQEASWQTYSGSFASTGYTQVRVEHS